MGIKFWKFSTSQILRVINFLWSYGVKNWHFEHSGGSEIFYLGDFQFSNMQFSQNSIFKTSKIDKIAIFELLKSATLISRKIWVAVKFWKFHIVQFPLHYFSVTQILREIKFGAIGSSKIAIVAALIIVLSDCKFE